MRNFFVPRISLKDHIVILFALSIVGIIVISIISKLTFGKESLLVGFFVYLIFLIYYFIMLYRGVRYDSGIVKWKWRGVKINEMIDGIQSNGINIGPIKFDTWDFGDDLFGIIIVFFLSFFYYAIFLLLICGLAWAGFNIIGYFLYLAWIPLYGLARFGLRLALANTIKSKGNLLRSISASAVHALFPAISLSISTYVFETYFF